MDGDAAARLAAVRADRISARAHRCAVRDQARTDERSAALAWAARHHRHSPDADRPGPSAGPMIVDFPSAERHFRRGDR